jgi:hypothetical protein
MVRPEPDSIRFPRRSADRGNEDHLRDPRDIAEIKKLQQRVRDLELWQEERYEAAGTDSAIWDDEEGLKETELGFIVWDDENVEATSIDQEPQYDEDGIMPDAEECLSIQKFLGWIMIQEERVEEADNNHKSSMVSSVPSRFEGSNKFMEEVLIWATTSAPSLVEYHHDFWRTLLRKLKFSGDARKHNKIPNKYHIRIFLDIT